MMMTAGLTSITFRKLYCDEIISLAVKAGLDLIEWGGDVHVPPKDLEKAKRVGEATRKAGLTVSSYGSYLRSGKSTEEEKEAVINAACALETNTIRVWAGTKGTRNSTVEEYEETVNDIRFMCEMACERGITIACEYHDNTLADSAIGTMELIRTVNHRNFRTYFQPKPQNSYAQNLEALDRMLADVENVHVFHWLLRNGGLERRLLAEGAQNWQGYIGMLRADSRDHRLLLEFVKDDDENNFLSDAKTLLSWLKMKVKLCY